MKERNEDMDHRSFLLEDTKSFLDDLHDEQIINISRRHIKDQPVPYVFTNKHGRTLAFTSWAMAEAKRYCLWLIEVGAVKQYVESDPHKPSSYTVG